MRGWRKLAAKWPHPTACGITGIYEFEGAGGVKITITDPAALGRATANISQKRASNSSNWGENAK